MEKWQQLDEHLSGDFTDGYWSEEALPEAMEWLHDLDEADWRALDELWKQRSSQWQERFGDLLADAPPGRAVPILNELLAAGEEKVAIAAADSLRSIASQGTDVMLSLQAVNRVRALAISHPGARSLTELLAKATFSE
jgi:hypothetical protein